MPPIRNDFVLTKTFLGRGGKEKRKEKEKGEEKIGGRSIAVRNKACKNRSRLGENEISIVRWK